MMADIILNLVIFGVTLYLVTRLFRKDGKTKAEMDRHSSDVYTALFRQAAEFGRQYGKELTPKQLKMLRAFVQFAAGKAKLERKPGGLARIAVDSLPATKMAFALLAGRALLAAAILMKAISFEQLNRRKAPN